MKKASLKNFFILLSTSVIATTSLLGFSHNKTTVDNFTNNQSTPSFSAQSFASQTVQSTQTKATAYFEKTVFQNADSFNYINVSLPLQSSEISDLNLDSLFISFTLSHPNAEDDNVMYLGYKNKVDEITNSILPTKVSLENGKYNEQSKTYTLTVKFSGMYAWDLSTFKFQLGLDGRAIEIKPTNKPQPKPIYESKAAKSTQTKVKSRKRRSVESIPSPQREDQMSDVDLLKLVQSTPKYTPPARPQWKSSYKDFKITPVFQSRSAEVRATTNHYKPNGYVTLNAPDDYLGVLDHSQWTGFVPDLRWYQVSIPNEYRFFENDERKFYINMNIQEGNKSSSVSYIVDGHKATLITNYGSNKNDISMFEKTYKADDNKGVITFQIRLGQRFDPAKSRLTMSFTGFRNGTYFQVTGSKTPPKVTKLSDWQQREVWNRGTWNKYVTIENSDQAKENDKLTVELKHPDAPDVTLHYKVEGQKLVDDGNNGNSIKFKIYNKWGKNIDVKSGHKFGFYVELSSLFDPTKTEIVVTFKGKTQTVNLPNFWNMFPERY
ncbi:hypothetical protein [Mesomycoplasma bovoculi]|uniref:Uncharacterized protein n=1 Tax=Mesomycoplasma bovoculi M165/69 TaxID=743966 RepID=W5UTX4_9BACT|nr:hypothetical protein [Mesomycoplasma bovoculi]AHH45270.1 hypothetical protein MYB_01300 [Mesomycoplasma bovoculi M165/69]